MCLPISVHSLSHLCAQVGGTYSSQRCFFEEINNKISMMTIRRNACRPLTYLPTSALALIYVSSLSLNILYPCSTCPSVFLFSKTSFFLCSYLLRLTPYIPLRPHLFIALSLSLFLSLYLSLSLSIYISFSLQLPFCISLSFALSV